MDRWEGKVAVVTGASTPIGAAIVERLVKAGLKVVGVTGKRETIDEDDRHFSGDLTLHSIIGIELEKVKGKEGVPQILVNAAVVDKNFAVEHTIMAITTRQLDKIHIININYTAAHRKVHDHLMKKGIKMTSVNVDLTQSSILSSSDEFVKRVKNDIVDSVMLVLSSSPSVHIPELTIDVVEEKY